MAFIPLTNSKKRVIVDDIFLPKLSKFKWQLSSSGYASRSVWRDGKPATILMHRVISQVPPKMVTDHINNNRLDNRVENLRVITNGQNTQRGKIRSNNSSGYRGVSFWNSVKTSKNWRARVWKDGKQVFCKYFHTPREAAVAYNSVVSKLFGSTAEVNIL